MAGNFPRLTGAWLMVCARRAWLCVRGVRIYGIILTQPGLKLFVCICSRFVPSVISFKKGGRKREANPPLTSKYQ